MHRYAFLLAALLFAAPVFAQPVEGTAPTAPGLQNADLPPLLDREVFTGDPEITSARLSPDGRFLTFRKPYNDVMNVWVKGIDEPFESARLLTADERPVPGYFWSEDGRYVLYVQDRGGDENYHVYALDPTAASGPDGVPPARDLTPVDGVRAFITAVPDATPGVIWVGLNDRDAAWHDLYRVDLATGERTLVYENTDRVTGYEFDLDGLPRLALRSAEDGSTEIMPFEDGALGEVVYSCTVQEACGPVRFHKNGRQVYMITNAGDRDLSELILLDPATGEETLVERDPEGRVDFGGTSFSDVTDELELTYYNGDRLRLYPKNDEVGADLDFLRANLPEGDVLPGSSTDDERTWLVTVTQATDPGATYVFDRDDRTVELLYRSRPNVPSEHMADMQAIRYTARDGMEIPAYLTIPKGTNGRNLPAIILPHGGPWARDGYGYSGLVQLFANRGYVVLQPNFRGSTGYGKAFLAAGDRGWGTGAMQHDLTDAAQYLIDQGIADPMRVGILGGSYGGYATLAGLAFTPDLYAAGVSIVGPSNLITLLESIPPYWASIRQMFYERMGDPETEEGRAQLMAQSPLGSADRITAPLLVIQGANDPRVKQAESDQIVIALRDRGYPVEYMVAPDEGHGFRGEMNRFAMSVVMERFLAEHLGGRMQTSVEPEVEAHLAGLMVDPATVTYTPASAATEGMGMPTFDGSALVPMRLSYDIALDIQGRTIELEDASREIVMVERDGEPALAIVDRAKLPAMMGGMAVLDSFVVARATLAPLHRTMRQGPGSIEVMYSDAKIEGQMSQGGQAMPFSVDLDAPVIADNQAFEIALSTMPLSEGYTAAFTTYDPSPGAQGLSTYTMTVAGMEEITVPAGTFQAYVIEIDKLDSNEDTTLYLRADDRMLVKSVSALPAQMGGGTVTAQLTATEM